MLSFQRDWFLLTCAWGMWGIRNSRQAKCFDVCDDSLGCPSSWGVWAPCRITAVILVGAQCLFRDTLFIDMQGWGLCFSIIPTGAPQNWRHTFLESLGLHLRALRVEEYLKSRALRRVLVYGLKKQGDLLG